MADTASRPLIDRVVRITVEEVDRATVGRFEAELTAQEPGNHCLVVDLRDVAFIDASGVRALLATAKAMWDAGGTIAIRNPRSGVRRVLDVLGLSQLLASN